MAAVCSEEETGLHQLLSLTATVGQKVNHSHEMT